MSQITLAQDRQFKCGGECLLGNLGSLRDGETEFQFIRISFIAQDCMSHFFAN